MRNLTSSLFQRDEINLMTSDPGDFDTRSESILDDAGGVCDEAWGGEGGSEAPNSEKENQALHQHH